VKIIGLIKTVSTNSLVQSDLKCDFIYTDKNVESGIYYANFLLSTPLVKG
jgi:hypothetical protein